MRPHVAPSGPVLVLTRRRRGFGLDAPRPPNLARLEAAILDWLDTNMRRIAVLRVAKADSTEPSGATTLALLLPAGRVAMLRIVIGPERLGAETLALAEQCQMRRVPLAIVDGVEEARAALRRFGLEPGEL